jgi:hypothetical protein
VVVGDGREPSAPGERTKVDGVAGEFSHGGEGGHGLEAPFGLVGVDDAGPAGVQIRSPGFPKISQGDSLSSGRAVVHSRRWCQKCVLPRCAPALFGGKLADPKAPAHATLFWELVLGGQCWKL